MNRNRCTFACLLRRCLPAAFLLSALGIGVSGCVPSKLPVPIAVPTQAPLLEPIQTPTPMPTADQAPVTLRYAMWDPLQVPAYEACAQQFMAQNPYITIVVEQTGGAKYWERLSADLQSGNAPDVFVNHLTHLPDLAAAGYILDLQPLVERDQFDDRIYLGRLPRLWVRAGARYGLPKDWDTIALVYNKDLLDAAGLTEQQVNELTWNPQDGGTFQNALGMLTIDSDGDNALSADFDPEQVVQYGLTMAGRDGGGSSGQQQWSHLAASNGFIFTDHLYADNYHYDDPALIETMTWYQRLIDELGYHTPFEQVVAQDGTELFLSGKAAMIFDGSWTIVRYTRDAPFDVGFARLPIGPLGRKSMFNGLADSIWSGTQHQEAAWAWVKYLGSVECQLEVGDHGVVLPSIRSGVDRMLAHYDELGVDISAYVAQVGEPDGTFLFPVTEHTDGVAAIMQPVIESILRGESDPADVLVEADAQVDALFGPETTQ